MWISVQEGSFHQRSCCPMYSKSPRVHICIRHEHLDPNAAVPHHSSLQSRPPFTPDDSYFTSRGMFAPLGTCAGQSVRLQQKSIKDSCSECKGGSFNHVHGKCWLLGYRSVLRNDLGESWRWCSICNIKAGCMPICRESQRFFLKYGNLRQEQTVNVMEALGATSFSLKAFEMHRCLYYSQVPWGIWRFMWRIQPVWESLREWWKVFSVYCAGTMVKLSVINTNMSFSEVCSQLLLLKRRLSSLSSAVLTDRQ